MAKTKHECRAIRHQRLASDCRNAIALSAGAMGLGAAGWQKAGRQSRLSTFLIDHPRPLRHRCPPATGRHEIIDDRSCDRIIAAFFVDITRNSAKEYLKRRPPLLYCAALGEVDERFKSHAWKACVG